MAAILACARDPDLDARRAAPSASVAAPSEAPLSMARRRAPGDNPFDFEAAPLSAAPGDFALVPSKTGIELAFERDAARRSLVYQGAFLEKVGEKESRVRWTTGERGYVSNALIVPIRRDERAAPAEIVLTSWASGSGLERAIVTGGSAESPKVRYLDLPVEDAGTGAVEDTLPPNTFHVLRSPGELGTTLACRIGGRLERVVLVKRSERHLLGLGFAGKMHVSEQAACAALPLVPDVRSAARVYVAHLGAFVEGRVESVSAATGRVLTRYQFAGVDQRAAVGFMNVALALPPNVQ